MTLRPGILIYQEKGQQEGFAVTGKTREPRDAELSLVLKEASGQNNSNLASLTALAENGGWELIKRWVPIIVFIPACFYPFYMFFATHVSILNIFGFKKIIIMSYSGLNAFILELERIGELHRVKQYIDPVLEITEITDRVTKSGGKALLFENTGTGFPVLINAFGSDLRMAMAIGRNNFDEAGAELEELFKEVSKSKSTFFRKISALPSFLKLGGLLPARLKRKGTCQQNIQMSPDLGELPVLKCWPHDGGRFITLPMVITKHPLTGSTNVGMYRMQILDKNTTAMHWQRHKTGASHFEAWKKTGEKMPVSVALGGDPVYTYAATAPLPENIDEFILAGFLRKKKVMLVRCITNDLYVPEDADIVIEGFVDPSEEPVWEGPFGDHTGFYSLADWYPKFHVTCITHSDRAVYPATIVGIPPQEDAWIAKATERLFLAPVRMTLQPEIEDFHMPAAGIAHNLVIVKIKKSYPGQGMKVLGSLSGAGQMMFTKYMVAVSGNVDIRDYKDLLRHILSNTDPGRDLLFSYGPLDMLDHSSDNSAFGGKVTLDATIKMEEELAGRTRPAISEYTDVPHGRFDFLHSGIVKSFNISLLSEGIPVVIVSVDRSENQDIREAVSEMFRENYPSENLLLILMVDDTVDVNDLFMVAWQVLGNTDPHRDHVFVSAASVLIDGTIKAYRKGGFSRKWPNVVTSEKEIISIVDQKWESLGLGKFVTSPSMGYMRLCRRGTDQLITD